LAASATLAKTKYPEKLVADPEPAVCKAAREALDITTDSEKVEGRLRQVLVTLNRRSRTAST
jgi:hypothetical protein